MNRQSGPQQGCSNQRPAPSGYYIFILIIPLHALKITLQYVFFPDIPQKKPVFTVSIFRFHFHSVIRFRRLATPTSVYSSVKSFN